MVATHILIANRKFLINNLHFDKLLHGMSFSLRQHIILLKWQHDDTHGKARIAEILPPFSNVRRFGQPN
jgi:hypothetical protein